MKTQGWLCSNTAFIDFDDVKVPEQYVIGSIGKGFKYCLENFNHERFLMAVQSCRFARLCLSHSIEFSRRRKTFGKRLCDHQVIRHKLFEISSKVEQLQLYVEEYAGGWSC